MITNDLQHIAVDINKPILDPANARHNHDLEAIAQSLDKYGQRKPIVVNKRTNFVLAGNGTLKAARSLGWKQIAVVFEDDDNQTAIGYALADNRLTDLSEFNNEALLLSLQQLDDIDSVPGFNQSEYDELLAEMDNVNGVIVHDPMAEWVGMPEFENEDNFGAIASIKVHLATIEDLEKFAKLMEQTVTEKTKSLWFPKQDRLNLKEYTVE